MIIGTGIYSTSIMLLSISRNYAELLIVQGVLSSTGAALLYVKLRIAVENWFNADAVSSYRFYPPIAAVSSHFTKYKATAVGIALSGSSLGEHGLLY